jgi:hypothetical protein
MEIVGCPCFLPKICAVRGDGTAQAIANNKAEQATFVRFMKEDPSRLTVFPQGWKEFTDTCRSAGKHQGAGGGESTTIQSFVQVGFFIRLSWKMTASFLQRTTL